MVPLLGALVFLKNPGQDMTLPMRANLGQSLQQMPTSRTFSVLNRRHPRGSTARMGQHLLGMGPWLLNGQGVTGTPDRLPLCVRQGLCIPGSRPSSPGLLKPQGRGGGDCPHSRRDPCPDPGASMGGAAALALLLPQPQPHAAGHTTPTPSEQLWTLGGHRGEQRICLPALAEDAPEGLYLPLLSLCTLPWWLS